MAIAAAGPGLRGQVNVSDLLAHFDEMGVPHFQRGLVWGQSAVALLLESLYFGTPCGSIILWTPPDVSAFGVPLVGDVPRFLIVDGQQRIRSLHAAFDAVRGDSTISRADPDDSTQDPAAEDQVSNLPEVWCMNVAKLAEFEADDRFSAGRRFRLFRRVPDPRFDRVTEATELTGALKQERDALIPLSWLLEVVGSADREELIADPSNEKVASAARLVLGKAAIVEQLAGMRTSPVFNVSILDESRSLADVVRVYARINSSGRPVEAEERAFASLVASCPGANQYLREFFARVHPERVEAPSGGLVRDSLEQRERENKFGFKLFMRVFTIVFAYHCDRVQSTGLAFDAVNADTLAKAVHQLPRILDLTVDLLDRLAMVMREGSLYCDDLRFLPDTSSLWPLIQLMVTFPALLAADTKLLEPVALSLVLADLPRREMVELLKAVSNAGRSAAALDLIERKTELVRVKRKIREGTAEQSLLDRYTSVLYWMLRSRGARDFSYKQPGLEGLTPPERELDRDADAQRQHIVPYWHLKRIFRLEGPRLTRHPANDIGNITYISAKQNDFLGGLGSTPVSLDHEPEDNRRSHFLDDPIVMADFSASVENAKSGNLKVAEARYARFSKRRRSLIEAAMLEWYVSARRDWPRGLDDTKPNARLVKPRRDDGLLEFGYPASVSGRLVELARKAAVSRARSDGRVSISLRPKGARSAALRVDVWRDGSRLAVKVSDDRLRSAFRRAFPELSRASTFANGKGKDKVAVAAETEMVSLLDWVAGHKPK
jgi:hypothetical protein